MLNFEIAQFLEPGLNLQFSIRSARSRAPYDFAALKFLDPGATPSLATCGMAEMPAPYGGAYTGTWTASPNPFWEPLYIVTVHDMGRPDAHGVTPAPRALFSFDVPFSKGQSVYSAPPFYTY